MPPVFPLAIPLAVVNELASSTVGKPCTVFTAISADMLVGARGGRGGLLGGVHRFFIEMRAEGVRQWRQHDSAPGRRPYGALALVQIIFASMHVVAKPALAHLPAKLAVIQSLGIYHFDLDRANLANPLLLNC